MTASTTREKLGPFPLGMDNRLPDHALFDLKEKETLLRSAVNVDVTNAGTLRRRQGRTKVISGSDCHSLFSSTQGHTYYVDFQDLKRLTYPDLMPTTIKGGLTPGKRMSMTDSPDGTTLYTNEVEIGRIVGDVVQPLGAPPLATVPLAVSTSVGSLEVGCYQVAFAYVNNDGEIGPATPVQTVELTQRGGIEVLGIGGFPTRVAGLHVYLSAANGEVMMRAATLEAPAPLVFSVPPTQGTRCSTLNKMSMPAGSIVRMYNGRVLVASGSVLYYSDPYSVLCTPSQGYIPFPEPITVVEPCNNGVYVVADQTYWFRGDLATAEANPVLPYGAVLHSSGQIANDNACWWMSTRGVVRGDQNGQANNIQEKHIVTGPTPTGAGCFIERNGLKQIIAPTFNTGSSGAAVASWMDAEIVRKGTTL